MEIDDALGKCQPDPQPALRLLARIVDLSEQVEDIRQLPGGYADTVVGDADDAAILLSRYMYADATIAGGELRCVVEQIGDNLGKANGIAFQKDRRAGMRYLQGVPGRL